MRTASVHARGPGRAAPAPSVVSIARTVAQSKERTVHALVRLGMCSCPCRSSADAADVFVHNRYFGSTCESSITWKWVSSSNMQLSWNLPGNGWHGKARIGRPATLGGSPYSNGMNGRQYYETRSSKSSVTVGSLYGKTPFFNVCLEP